MENTISSASDGSCYYCGVYHHGVCQRIEKIEYFENGAVKTVTLFDIHQFKNPSAILRLRDDGTIEAVARTGKF